MPRFHIHFGAFWTLSWVVLPFERVIVLDFFVRIGKWQLDFPNNGLPSMLLWPSQHFGHQIGANPFTQKWKKNLQQCDGPSIFYGYILYGLYPTYIYCMGYTMVDPTGKKQKRSNKTGSRYAWNHGRATPQGRMTLMFSATFPKAPKLRRQRWRKFESAHIRSDQIR